MTINDKKFMVRFVGKGIENFIDRKATRDNLLFDTALELPDHIVWRQPFPGPGLGIRVLGEVTEEMLHIVREAGAILREEMSLVGLSRDIWQYFAVLPNIRSVGVRDDVRSYDYTACCKY